MAKIRLDALLVKNGLVQSRERAKAIIMAGQVYIDNQKCDKAGQQFDEDTAKPEVRGETLKYVSRGGLKLEKAMKEFPVTLEGKTASIKVTEDMTIIYVFFTVPDLPVIAERTSRCRLSV